MTNEGFRPARSARTRRPSLSVWTRRPSLSARTRRLASPWIVIALLLNTLPAQASNSDAAILEVVGQARLDVLLWSVYDSKLLAPEGIYHPGVRPLRLEITYLRDIAAQALIKQTRKEWQHLGLDHPEQDQWLQRLAELWPDINKRDTLALELAADGSSRFFFNGSLLGSVGSRDFGTQFLAIWLSPDTSRPALRRALLGRGN